MHRKPPTIERPCMPKDCVSFGSFVTALAYISYYTNLAAKDVLDFFLYGCFTDVMYWVLYWVKFLLTCNCYHLVTKWQLNFRSFEPWTDSLSHTRIFGSQGEMFEALAHNFMDRQWLQRKKSKCVGEIFGQHCRITMYTVKLAGHIPNLVVQCLMIECYFQYWIEIIILMMFTSQTNCCGGCRRRNRVYCPNSIYHKDSCISHTFLLKTIAFRGSKMACKGQIELETISVT